MSFGPLLLLFERHGGVVMPSRSLDKLVAADVRAALHTANIVLSASPAPTWPCDVRGCSGREVRASYDGAPRPLVAVCSEAPPSCEPVYLGFDDVAQKEVSLAAFVRTVCGLLGAEIARGAEAKLREVHPIGGSRPPLLVSSAAAVVRAAGATRAHDTRDIYWAGSPRDMDLTAFCERRDRLTRSTLVLVPTARHVPLEVASRYGHGERVEVLVLEDVLRVNGDVLALVGGAGAPPRGKRGEAAREAAKTPGIAADLGVTSWEVIRITLVDDQTVRIEANGKTVLRTFAELGFVDKRGRGEAKSVTGWSLFALVCRQGSIRPSEYAKFGSAYAATKAMSRVTIPLCAAFGLKEKPMRKYSPREGWLPRFRVAAR